MTLSMSAIEWAVSRKISQKTLECLGVASGTVWFSSLNKRSEAIFFKYQDDWKARSFPEKGFTASPGAKFNFWNLENVLRANPNTVYITEGELDVCALVEAGIPIGSVLSVPTGAHKRAEEAQERGYSYVEEALKVGLNRVKRFVWCGDNDDPGKILRDDMVQIIGPARMWFVEWPEGCKDANETLIAEGPEFVRELLTDGALQWPVIGLYHLMDLPEPPPLTLWHPGFPEWESRMYLAPRTMSVVTGHPGGGKTVCFNQVWHQIVREYDLVRCMATFETRPKPHVRRQLRTLITGKLEYAQKPDEIKKADEWINDHYIFLVHPEQRPTLEWFLEMAEVAVIRHGARIITLDPWNRLEASRRSMRETETEYIARCLRTIHVFANDFNCHFQITAHPAKMDGPRRGKPPELEDLHGCYSDDTEVLTDRGWLKHSDILLTDKVACFSFENDKLAWMNPSKVWQYNYTGPMHRHRYRGGDLLVTENHKMVVRPGWKKPSGNIRPQGGGMRPKYNHDSWNLIESRELFGGKWLVPQSCDFVESDIVGTDTSLGYDEEAFWEYVGWWIAEGWNSLGGLGICQADERSDRLKFVMSRMPVQYTARTYEQKGKDTLPIWVARIGVKKNRSLCAWILHNCGIGCENKKIPSSAWTTSRKNKKALFDGLMGGDGHRHRSGWSYTTVSNRLADDVQRLAIEIGYTAQKRKLPDVNRHPHYKIGYQVNINNRKNSALHPYRNSSVEHYDGSVWCLTVPTGAYVVRRNGWASICGNSRNWENMIDQGFVIHRPQLFDGNVRKTEAVLYHKKARFEELGYPCQFQLRYDLNTGRFVSMEYEQ